MPLVCYVSGDGWIRMPGPPVGGVVSAAGTGQGRRWLVHQGLLYGSEQEFLAGTVPFIQDGLTRGAPIWVMSTVRNAGWLRVALGAARGR